jgi:hypothetical protein
MRVPAFWGAADASARLVDAAARLTLRSLQRHRAQRSPRLVFDERRSRRRAARSRQLRSF